MVAARVAAALGIAHVSAGDFMREMAAERGVSILDLSRSAQVSDSIDREIDSRTVRLAEESGGFVMDARLGWHFIPQSVKIFLDVSLEEGARRVYEAGRGAEQENVDLESTLSAIEARTESERQRYFEYYGLGYTDHQHYDFVQDTSSLSIDEVVEAVIGHVGRTMS